MTPEICPNCGAEVPRRAKACPECGADEQTGWSEEAATSGLGLPQADFDYERFVQEEFGEKGPAPRKARWVWWVVAAGLAAVLLFLWSR